MEIEGDDDLNLEKIINSIDQEPYYREKEGVLYCADCMDILPQIPKESVDLVLTDPPYGNCKKDLGEIKVFYDVLPALIKVLKENSWFITFYSISNIKEALNYIPLSYVWLYHIYYVNIQRILHCPLGRTKVSTALVYRKGNPKGYYHIRDVYHCIYRYGFEDVGEHKGSKPVGACEVLIQFGCQHNSIVLDPFIGSGTTAVASKKLGRQWIGIEISQKYCDIAVRRLKKVRFGESLKFLNKGSLI